MVKKQSVTKCNRNNCIVYNKLNAKLQKSVTFYAIKSIFEKFIILMNDEKEKKYINIGKKCNFCNLFSQFLSFKIIIRLHFVLRKCNLSVTSVTALQELFEEAAA